MRTLFLAALLFLCLFSPVACSGPPSDGFARGPDAGAGAGREDDASLGTDDADPVVVTGGDDLAEPDADPDADPGEVIVVDDAGSEADPIDATPEGACGAPPAAGDLAIVELMIASVAGSGDHGEWIEIASARDCALDLRGLHGDVPVGSKVATFDVDDDVWLAPRGRFVVADSSDPAIEHDVPAPVVTWLGEPGDVLRNQGSTITLRLAGAIVDSVTYPPSKLPPGTSLAFPADCDPAARGDWARWQPSVGSWFPGFLGTPNAANDDVHCH